MNSDPGFGPNPCIESLPMAKRRLIIEALKATQGRRAEAAYMLQMGRTTLFRKIKEFEISASEYRFLG